MPQIKIRDPALRAAVASCYIERNRIHLGRKIKEGNFGVVYDAKWNQSSERTRRVAAKTMKNIESQQQLENFLKEGVMMKGNGLNLFILNIFGHFLFTDLKYVYCKEVQKIYSQ